MPRLRLDYDADTTKVIRKTTQLEGILDDFSDNIRSDMMRMRNFTELFSQGLEAVGKAFDFAAKQAEKLGRADVAENIKEMQAAGENLLDVLVQVPLAGRDFLQWMGDAAQGATNLARLVGALSISMQLNTGQISYETAQLQLNAMMTDENATKTKQLEDDKTELAAATKAQSDAEKRLQETLKDTEGYRSAQAAMKTSETNLASMRAELQRLTILNGKAAFSERELYDMRLDVQQATVDEQRSAIDLRKAQEEVNIAQGNGTGASEDQRIALEQAYLAHKRSELGLQDSKAALDKATTATIDNSAAISTLTQRLQEESDKLDQAKQKALDYAAALGKINDAARYRQELQAVFSSIGGIQERASGGSFVAGGAYFINESPSSRPETIVTNGAGGGTVMTRQQMEMMRGGGGVTIQNVNLNNRMDIAELVASLKLSVAS